METYFAYPANPISTSMQDDADIRPVKIASMEDISTVPEVNQVQLVKLPPKTRRHTSSPLNEDQKDSCLSNPAPVMDMAKPQAPLESAWVKASPPTSTRLSQVSPAPESDQRDSEEVTEEQRKSSSLFIADTEQSAATQHKQHRTSTSKKCVIS